MTVALLSAAIVAYGIHYVGSMAAGGLALQGGAVVSTTPMAITAGFAAICFTLLFLAGTPGAWQELSAISRERVAFRRSVELADKPRALIALAMISTLVALFAGVNLSRHPARAGALNVLIGIQPAEHLLTSWRSGIEAVVQRDFGKQARVERVSKDRLEVRGLRRESARRLRDSLARFIAEHGVNSRSSLVDMELDGSVLRIDLHKVATLVGPPMIDRVRQVVRFRLDPTGGTFVWAESPTSGFLWVESPTSGFLFAEAAVADERAVRRVLERQGVLQGWLVVRSGKWSATAKSGGGPGDLLCRREGDPESQCARISQVALFEASDARDPDWDGISVDGDEKSLSLELVLNSELVAQLRHKIRERAERQLRDARDRGSANVALELDGKLLGVLRLEQLLDQRSDIRVALQPADKEEVRELAAVFIGGRLTVPLRVISIVHTSGALWLLPWWIAFVTSIIVAAAAGWSLLKLRRSRGPA